MSDAWIRWAPGAREVFGPSGSSGAEQLLGPSRPPARDSHEAQSAGGERTDVLHPVLADGTLGRLQRFRGRPGALLRARLTAPRSASLAERAWNLICHLRAHGVGTLEPLAVGAAGRGLVSTRSFLLTRALPEGVSLDDWRRAERDPAERERGEEALELAFERLRAARVQLPRSSVSNVWITSAGCGRLPGVVFADLGGGRVQYGARATSAT